MEAWAYSGQVVHQGAQDQLVHMINIDHVLQHWKSKPGKLKVVESEFPRLRDYESINEKITGN